jgi:DNA helicase-2/ATP-dependent DNA helicase PcrA
VKGQLPIRSQVELLVGEDEADEATLVAEEVLRLCREGHPDIEGNVTPASCAVLGRGSRGIPYFKRVTALHENESDLADDFQLALRTVANPRDQLHMAALLKPWNLRLVDEVMSDPAQITALLKECATATSEARCHAIADAINLIGKAGTKLNMKPAIDVLRNYADTLSGGEKEAIYDDTEVMLREWDQYLRGGSFQSRTLPGFLSSMALGTSQQLKTDGAPCSLQFIHRKDWNSRSCLSLE